MTIAQGAKSDLEYSVIADREVLYFNRLFTRQPFSGADIELGPEPFWERPAWRLEEETQRKGFGCGRYDWDGSTTHYRGVWISNWMAMGALSILPACWFVRRFPVRRLNVPGKCARCGYDLRASPQRCPECGAERPNAALTGNGLS